MAKKGNSKEMARFIILNATRSGSGEFTDVLLQDCRRAGCSERTFSAAKKELIAQGLVTETTGWNERAGAVYPKLVGTGKAPGVSAADVERLPRRIDVSRGFGSDMLRVTDDTGAQRTSSLHESSSAGAVAHYLRSYYSRAVAAWRAKKARPAVLYLHGTKVGFKWWADPKPRPKKKKRTVTFGKLGKERLGWATADVKVDGTTVGALRKVVDTKQYEVWVKGVERASFAKLTDAKRYAKAEIAKWA